VQLAERAGNLYMAWLTQDQPALVSSRDGGRTWSPPLAVSPPGVHNLTLPALAAGPPGAVGLVYYATPDASAKQLSGYVSTTTDGLAPPEYPHG